MKKDMNQAKRSLLIDGQVFQTEAWHRGMGKYSLSLIRSLNNGETQKRYDSVGIILNTNLPMNDDVRKTLQEALPEAVFIEAQLRTPEEHTPLNDIRSQNKHALAGHIADPSLADYLIPSLFIDEACIVFPEGVRKFLIFYDLIPFLYHNRYKSRINYTNYLDHFATIFEADLLFNISQTVADDNAVYLGILEQKLVTIDGASIDRSTLPSKKPDISISKKEFILMPTGDEIRKNNLRAVQGFEHFNALEGGKYQLVITSRVSDHTRAELESVSDDVLFSGNVDEHELQWLYENASMVLFPPEYEGLGLPILEALSVDKKVACSNIPVFREISQDALYFFDHYDPHAIARVLKAATYDSSWLNKQRLYKDILSRYTWDETARKFYSGIDRLNDQPKVAQKKPKVAVLTPHPAGFSAIGKVAAETHDAMLQQFDVTYYFDHGAYHQEVRPEFLSHVADCREATTFNAQSYKEFDAVFYHIGNSDYHLETIKNALYLPGFAILHDTHLNGAYQGLEEAGYISSPRREAERVVGVDRMNMSEYLDSVVRNQLGIITHSNYAKKAVDRISDKSVHARTVNLPVYTPVLQNDIHPVFHIGLAGIIADVKGVGIIEDIASSPVFEESTISIFGHSFAKPEVAEQFSKWPHVKVYPDPTDLEFQSRLTSLDVLVNYRLEYRGETSLTTLEAMRYGTTVIVRDKVGWYAELPDNTVVKAETVEDVIEKLAELHDDQHARETIRRTARELTRAEFTHTQYVDGLLKLMHETEYSKDAGNSHTYAQALHSATRLPDLKKLR